MKSKPATEATIEANRKFAANLPLHNNDDLGDIRRGLMEQTRNLVIRDDTGNIVWDIKSFYDIVDANPTCPDTVNPGYWRHECRETIAGLFEVFDSIAAGEKSVGEYLGSGEIQATSDIGQLEKMFATLEDIPNYFFGIATP